MHSKEELVRRSNITPNQAVLCSFNDLCSVIRSVCMRVICRGRSYSSKYVWGIAQFVPYFWSCSVSMELKHRNPSNWRIVMFTVCKNDNHTGRGGFAIFFFSFTGNSSFYIDPCTRAAWQSFVLLGSNIHPRTHARTPSPFVISLFEFHLGNW